MQELRARATAALDRSIAIVIPAYNEAATIAGVVRDARDALPQAVVYVVDDQSRDATAGAARAAGAIVLAPALRLGAWGATQVGLRAALLDGARVIVAMDGDGQHHAAAIPMLLEPVESGAADLVIGSCPERVSGLRRAAWRWLRTVSALAIEDLTSGFRAYSRRAARIAIGAAASNLDWQDLGVLLLLRDRGVRIVEVPVAMSARAHGHSHLFASWWTVAEYMTLSSLIGGAKRSRRSRP